MGFGTTPLGSDKIVSEPADPTPVEEDAVEEVVVEERYISPDEIRVRNGEQVVFPKPHNQQGAIKAIKLEEALLAEERLRRSLEED